MMLKSHYNPLVNAVIATLMAEEEGAFVVRESTSFAGCLGVAVRVSRVPANAPFITSERAFFHL